MGTPRVHLSIDSPLGVCTLLVVEKISLEIRRRGCVSYLARYTYGRRMKLMIGSVVGRPRFCVPGAECCLWDACLQFQGRTACEAAKSLKVWITHSALNHLACGVIKGHPVVASTKEHCGFQDHGGGGGVTSHGFLCRRGVGRQW